MSPTMYFILAMSVSDFGFFIIAMWVRNQNLGTPPAEGGPGQNAKRRLAAAAWAPVNGAVKGSIKGMVTSGPLP